MRGINIFRICLSALVCLAFGLGFTSSVRADLQFSETTLNPAGWVFEANPDEQGLLWITDQDAGQVWGLYPEDEFFEIYPVMGHPSDARHAGDSLWWADGTSNILGWASTLNGDFLTWQVAGVTGFAGTAVDVQGRFWAADASSGFLYRLDTSETEHELCKLVLPGGGKVTYIANDGTDLWVGDYANERILRLKVSDNSLATWTLPADSSPLGMVVDGAGKLWYADSNLNRIAQLDPDADTDQLTIYPLPRSTSLGMLALQDGKVWYTSSKSLTSAGSMGILDPTLAASTSFDSEEVPGSITPACSPISPSGSGSLTITTEDTAWGTVNYPTLVDSGGWQIFQLPEGASPWGIASMDGIWLVDQGRQVLVKLPKATESYVYLPLLIQ